MVKISLGVKEGGQDKAGRSRQVVNAGLGGQRMCSIFDWVVKEGGRD